MRATSYNRITASNGRGLGVIQGGLDRITSYNRITDAEDLAALFDERAAILEYDGGYSRAKAEALARAEIGALRRRKDRP
jgi:hypothetical protein